MGTGAFSSAEILTDASAAKNGALLKLIFGDPTSWTAAFTVSTDPTKWPRVYVNGSTPNVMLDPMGNAVDGPTMESAPAVNGSNLEMTVRLSGYVYSAESTITVDVPAAFVTDSLGNTTGATTGSAVTNSSTKTAGSALTRMQGAPVVAWAIRNEWPHDGVAQGDVPTDRIRVAFDAVDFWAGVDYVEVTFSYAAVVVTDSTVTSLGSNVYKIASKRRCDLYGYGNDNDYWYCDVNISAASDGNQGTVSITKVRTLDGVDHNPSSSHISGGRVIPAYTLTVRKTKTLRYLDANAVGAADGTSWADAWTDLSTAEAAVTTTVDEVRVAPGTYTEAGMTFDQSRTGRYVKWIYDGTGPSGAGTATFAFSGTTNFKAYNGFKDITFTIASSGLLRIASSSNISFENTPWTFADNGSGSDNPFGSGSYISLINVYQTKGYRGCSIGRVGTTVGANLLFHGGTLDNSGTYISGQFYNVLIEGHTAKNCAGTDYAPGTHFDYFHPFATITLTGAGWTDATKTITKVGGFTDFGSVFDDETAVFSLTAGTGCTVGRYRIASRTNDTAVTVLDINGAGGDIADASVAGSLLYHSYENTIIRNCRAYDNGTGGGNNYNFALITPSGYNFAIYNNWCFHYQSTQQIVQIQGNPRNMQIVANTLLAIDNNAQTGSRGVNLSGSECANPYDQHGLLMVNNAIATYVGSLGAHASGNVPNLYYRKRYYAGNVSLEQSPTNPIVDSNTKLSAYTLATLAMVDLSTAGAYVPSPAAGSPLLTLGQRSYLVYDFPGRLLSTDGTAGPSPGAWQPIPTLTVTYDGASVSDGGTVTETAGTKSLVMSAASGITGSVVYISDVAFGGTVTGTDASPYTLTSGGSTQSATISTSLTSGAATVDITYDLGSIFDFDITGSAAGGGFRSRSRSRKR